MEAAEVIVIIAAVFLVALLGVGGSIAMSRNPEFAGHPKGLYMLFFAEMWERFSYYGMRALLILYLVSHWQFDDGKANLIYGAYTSLVYITPLLGGYLADRYLGQRKAVLFGAILLTCGHMLMAFEGNGGQADPTINIFWLALSFIIVGSGFLKANISVMVGQLYPRTDVRRDGAYTIFYMGINVGAAIGTIIAGYLGQTYGWRYGFGAAGIGMLLGLIVFIGFRPLLQGRGEAPDPARLSRSMAGIRFEWVLYALGIAAIAAIWGLIQYQGFYGWVLLAMGTALLLYVLTTAIFLMPYGTMAAAPEVPVLVYLAGIVMVIVGFGLYALDPTALSTPGTAMTIGASLIVAVMLQQSMTKQSEGRDRIFAIIFLIALQPVFWALFEQAGGSLNLYTDRYVDRQGVPASLFQSINPIYIILLGPLFAWLWTALGRKGLEPSTPAKFGLALLQVGFSFLVLVWGAQSVGMAAMTPVIFIFLIYLFQTTGELCLSPVGLSAMNRLAPRHMASLIMGAWFFATAGGNFLAGVIGHATGGESGEMSKEATLDIYWTIGLITIAIGVAVVLVSPLVKRLMHLNTLRDDDDGLAGTAYATDENQAAGLFPNRETKPGRSPAE